MDWLARIKGWLFPTRCIACQQVGPDILCDSCAHGIEYVGSMYCQRCGRRRRTEFVSPDCGECSGRSIGVSRARSMLIYNDLGRRLLAEYKFKHHIGVGELLVDRLVEWSGEGFPGLYGEPDLEFDVCVPVPLNARRMRERRFNQADLIGRRLESKSGISCEPGALARVRHTESQVGLSATQRRVNVRGAFAVPEARRGLVEGKRVLLVDDLMTTGATLHACSVALRKGGASLVHGLTLFSTVHDVEPVSRN